MRLDGRRESQNVDDRRRWKIRFDLTPLAKVMLTPKNYLFLTL